MASLDEEFEKTFESESDSGYSVEDYMSMLSGIDEDINNDSEDQDEGDIYALANMYGGNSEGFRSLVAGYSAYAFETMQNRSFPDVRDGLKPVQRRILYAMYLNQKHYRSEQTSANLVGDVLPWHPHGDSAIYSAAVRMTDLNKSFMIPLIKSRGNLGSVNNPGKEAASRYTKMWNHPNTADFLADMDGAFFKEAEIDETKEEPAFLPVRYPFVLCNAATGIGVGMATNIPAYNFFDVIDMTEEYLKTGSLRNCTKAPDFPTGGFVLEDPNEFRKIINVGKGKVHIRAKVEITNKNSTINVLEIPYGQTMDSIIDRINNIINPRKDQTPNPIDGLRSVSNFTDRNGSNITVECQRGTAERVLLALYARGILQTTFVSNMNTVNGNQPLIGGVVDIIKAWYEARRKVLLRKFAAQKESLKQEFIDLSYFLRLVMNPKWKAEYLHRITEVSTQQANIYLHEIFDDIPEETVKWISGRRAAEFNKGGKYRDRMEAVKRAIEEASYNESHVKEYVLKDLEALRSEHNGRHPRISELTTKTYKFIKPGKEINLKDAQNNEALTAEAWVAITEDGLLYKTRDRVFNDAEPTNTQSKSEADKYPDGVLYQGYHAGTDVLVGFDLYGRVVRVFLDQFAISNKPYSLADYFEISNDMRKGNEFAPAWRILYMTNFDGKSRYIMYTNGKSSLFNTEEFQPKSVRRRIINNAMPEDIVNEMLDIIHEDDMPENILVIGHNRDRGYYKVGWYATEDIRSTSSAKARIRVLSGVAPIIAWRGIDENELHSVLSEESSVYGAVDETAECEGRMRRVSDGIAERVAEGCRYGGYASE